MQPLLRVMAVVVLCNAAAAAARDAGSDPRLLEARWQYEASLLPPQVKVAPAVALVPGGGVAGLAVTF